MEEIKDMFLNLQQDIKKQKEDMVKMKEDIKNIIVNSLTEKLSSLELKNELLEQKIEEQNRKMNNLERQSRRKNLVMFGVEERENSYHELEEMIISIINTNFKVSCETNSIEAVRRLGKKGEKTRPVVITFNTLGLKLKIQKDKYCLQKTAYYIKEDYPIEILKKRKELQAQLEREKEAGNRAIIRYDKLIILNKKHSPRNQPNKRYLSESPETPMTASQETQHVEKQPLKKTKARNMKSYITQTPKLVFAQKEAPQNQTNTSKDNAK
ncbi:uncharacterized protein LOC114250777 [Bombyx mandarina]|uniref:Uncharacterized protein LOC114250777 n=1 Tax=Bombyx mandarina TaxID=7092 RepID=A0A6J2KE36_BOMMA|nr:uncharacterized protein LOC114250777 [Bombyx mandarina]